ncbi:MAG: hypothetical protein ACE5J6_00490 [Candidatus Bathyarchaeia archaeon]
MRLKTKLKVENPAALILSIFYAIVGMVFLSIFVVYDFKPPHVAIIGVLSLITAYGVFKMEKWAVWLVVALFVLGNAFGIPILITTNPWTATSGLLLQSLLIIYLIITWVISVYVVAKRKNFQ